MIFPIFARNEEVVVSVLNKAVSIESSIENKLVLIDT